jgi:hypothetical protein
MRYGSTDSLLVHHPRRLVAIAACKSEPPLLADPNPHQDLHAQYIDDPLIISVERWHSQQCTGAKWQLLYKIINKYNIIL